MDALLWLPDEDARAAELARPRVVAIGNFDGVHRGHQAVIAQAKAQAQARGIAASALTFDPHPSDVLGKAPAAKTKLSTLERRVELLVRAGAERVFVRRFDHAFAASPPDVFARELLVKTLHAKLVLVGENFRFGANREGDRVTLAELGASCGFDVEVHEIAGDAAGPFSSSRARAAIACGDLAEAERVLGRHHALTGVVAHGEKLGRTLGFPTANLAGVEEALPPDGIYATVVDEIGADGKAHALAIGALSIGLRPSIPGAVGRTIEVHLLDFDRDLYGVRLRVHLVAHLRDEARFPSLDELKQQIAADVNDVRVKTAWIVVGRDGAYG